MGVDFGISEAMMIGSLAMGAVGAGVSAIGAASQGQAEAAANRYQAQVAANNAQIAQQNASYASQIGNQQASEAQQKSRATAGAIKAAQAANGVDVNTGSAVDVRSSAEQNGELSALLIRSNAARQAYGYESQGTSFQAQSGLDQAAASNAESAGTLGAIGSVVGGASNLAGKYVQWQQAAGTGGGQPTMH